MSVVLLVAAAFAWCLGGFTALGLAMDRHWEDIHGRGREPGRWRPWLRLAGAAGIALGLVFSAQARGWGMGPVLWCGLMTAATLLLSLVLSYRPRSALTLGMLSASVALPASLLGGWLA